MNVFVIGTRGFPNVQGGVERHCEELYARVAALGCDVTVAARTPYIPAADRVAEFRGVKLRYYWCPRKKAFEAIVHSLIAVLAARRHAVDVLHIHAIGPALITPLAKLLGLKVVVTHHGCDYERQKWGTAAKVLLRLGERFGLTCADHAVVLSEPIRDALAAKYRCVPMTVIPNGVPTPTRIPPGQTLATFNLQPRRYVFTAARFVPEKGLHDLIAAFSKIDRLDVRSRNPVFA